MNEDLHDRVLQHLAANPHATQRALARALGGTNDGLRARIERGWVKMQN